VVAMARRRSKVVAQDIVFFFFPMKSDENEVHSLIWDVSFFMHR
jgi:hypothetical protein